MEAIEHLRSHDVIAGDQVSNERQTHRPTLKHCPKNQTLSSDRGLPLPAQSNLLVVTVGRTYMATCLADCSGSLVISYSLTGTQIRLFQ